MENEDDLMENKMATNQAEFSDTNNDHSPEEIHETNEEIHDEEIHDDDLSVNSKVTDFSNFEKKDFVGLLKEAAANNDFKKADHLLRDIKPLFDGIRNTERIDALIRFKQNGGSDEDFEYKGDEWDHAFDLYVKSIRENRQRHVRDLEEQKKINFQLKTNLLEKLRQLVDGEDTKHSLGTFKEIQNEWKAIGIVPQAQIKLLWANYNALIDRFYDQRSIHFELKELDRKKNLQLKEELVTRAERLLDVEKIHDAVSELNELHSEFRHIGPVPIEEKEKVWLKFKAASDKVYARRDAIASEAQIEQAKNLIEKEKVNDEIAVFATFQSDRIKEWNQKAKEVAEIQKRWEAIGLVPRAKTKEVNKKFWGSFKAFFHNKSIFFKKLDEERNKNLGLKRELIANVNALKESSDWNKTAQSIKAIQLQWKEIGSVPERQQEKIYAQFKEACDFFFVKKRESMSEEEKAYHDNLIKKESIIAELESIIAAKNGSLAQVRECQKNFLEIGFVPKHLAIAVKDRFFDTLRKAIASLPLGKEEMETATLEAQVSMPRQHPQGEKKLQHKEYGLRKQITKAESDLATLRNNLEFFGRSKNAEKMKEEFKDKIKQAEDELSRLKKQMQLLHGIQ